MQRRLYNIQLCYHGIVATPEETLTFRTYIEDFKAQILHMLDLGYQCVYPAQFFDWYKGRYIPTKPIFCIVFDDGLDSVELAGEWLVEQNLPFGIPLITRRHQKKEPESGFMTWEKIKYYYDSGLLEVMHHTHNSHHLNLSQKGYSYYDDALGQEITGTYIDSAPVYEGPCFYDNGDHLYMLPGDTRQYFDFSIVETTFGFPLMGTDPNTGRPITSSLKITPTKTMSVNNMRLWAALHWPPSGGYSVNMDVYIDGQFLCEATYEPTDYETRSQWKEREFTTLELSQPFNIVEGEVIEIKLVTKNRGEGAFRVYSLPWFPGEGDAGEGVFQLFSDCINMDVEPGKPWPCRPCIILSDGTGRKATDLEYQGYIDYDFEQTGVSLNKYLAATWVPHKNPYDPLSEVLEVAVIGGTYPDGTAADTYLRFDAAETFTAETLKWVFNKRYGDRYEAVCDISIGEGAPDIPGHTANVVKVARIQWNWADYKVKEIGITPYTFEAGKTYWIRFKTLNATSGKWGLMTILMDQPGAPQPYWAGGDAGGWVHPGPEQYDASTWFKVKQAYGTDVYANGTYTDANNDWFWTFRTDGTGPGKPFIDLLELQSLPVPYPKTLCYPFGAYYSNEIPGVDAYGFDIQRVEDIHPKLKEVMLKFGVESGWSIWPSRMVTETESQTRERAVRYNDYSLPRFLIYGNIPNETVINNINAYIGLSFQDVTNLGYKWQTSQEYSQLINGTMHTSELDFMAFDAYYLQVDGTIKKGPVNEADRTKARERGILQTFILSNYDFAEGGPSATVAEYVLSNQELFIQQAIDIAVAENWDGITLNIEWVPSTMRDQATLFVKTMGEGLRAVKKVFHMTCPAITGTEKWDYIDWMGWADHEELIKHVDAIKIMTYTESGEFGPAAPHAPDEFMKLVYDYLKNLYKGSIKARVLIGCNSYGHLWDYTAGTLDEEGQPVPDVEYITFHDGMAYALKFGAAIEIKEGEGYWQTVNPITKKINRQCYFGIPETIQRAVEIAEANGFGGVGMWKADDGDTWEHFAIKPQTKKIKQSNVEFKKLKIRV